MPFPASARSSLLAGLGALALLGAAGCTPRAALTDAMRQQESEMADESGAWNDQLALRRVAHEDMRAWLARSDSGAGTGARAEIGRHDAALDRHDRNAAAFQTALDAHRLALEDAAARPGLERAATHADRYHEHTRLRAMFEQLAAEHERIVADHRALAARLGPAPVVD